MKKLGNNQGILIWMSGKSGKAFLEKYFSVINFLFALFSVNVHFHILKHFPTFSCYEYYVAAWIFVFKDILCLIVTCLIAE